jgi:hypothetical protein
MDPCFRSRNSFLSLITHIEVVMRSKSHLELIPIDAFGFYMSFNIRIPPISYGAYKLVRSQQDLLPVVALHNLKLLLYSLEPIISIHGFHGVQKGWWLGPLEFSKLVSL